jgi:hypothetical protein
MLLRGTNIVKRKEQFNSLPFLANIFKSLDRIQQVEVARLARWLGLYLLADQTLIC